MGRVIEVFATLDIVDDKKVNYDRFCAMNFRTEKGLVGRCIQDVVTYPPRKWARIQYENGCVEWECAREPGIDFVTALMPGNVSEEHRVRKTRPEDFIEELLHIEAMLKLDPTLSPISIDRGLESMLIIAAAYLSGHDGRRVKIDYTKGFCLEALSFN
jgi:predicted dehydrogenase